jgi:hypothetical protein
MPKADIPDTIQWRILDRCWFPAPYVSPIFNAHVIVDFDWLGASVIQTVSPILTGAGNPEIIACINIKVVCFEARAT